MSEDFAERCAAAVAAVPLVLPENWREQSIPFVFSAVLDALADRDARIGRGMAAALAQVRCDTSDANLGACDECRLRALTAFAETAK